MTPADLIGIIVTALALLVVGAGGKTWWDSRHTEPKEDPDEKPEEKPTEPTPASDLDSSGDAEFDADTRDRLKRLRERSKRRLDELRRVRK